jgi:hypothetical protein
MDSAGPGLTVVASACEHGNAGSGSVKENSLPSSNYKLFNGTSPWNKPVASTLSDSIYREADSTL